MRAILTLLSPGVDFNDLSQYDKKVKEILRLSLKSRSSSIIASQISESGFGFTWEATNMFDPKMGEGAVELVKNEICFEENIFMVN